MKSYYRRVLLFFILASAMLSLMRNLEFYDSVIVREQFLLLFGSFVLYVAMMLYLTKRKKKTKPNAIFYNAISGFIAVKLYPEIIRFSDTMASKPTLLGHLLAIVLAFAGYKLIETKQQRRIYSFVLLVMYIAYACWGYEAWFKLIK